MGLKCFADEHYFLVYLSLISSLQWDYIGVEASQQADFSVVSPEVCSASDFQIRGKQPGSCNFDENIDSYSDKMTTSTSENHRDKRSPKVCEIPDDTLLMLDSNIHVHTECSIRCLLIENCRSFVYTKSQATCQYHQKEFGPDTDFAHCAKMGYRLYNIKTRMGGSDVVASFVNDYYVKVEGIYHSICVIHL